MMFCSSGIRVATAAMWTTVADASHAVQLQFDIAGQPLSGALKDFARQSGLQVARFSENSDARAQAVNSRLTAAEALEQLLVGSGHTWRYVNDHTVAIIRIGSPSGSPAGAAIAAGPPAGNESTEGVATTMNRSKFLSRIAVLLGSIAGAVGAPSMYAAAADEASAVPSVLEEVVVTAERRVANVQDIAIAMTVLAGDALDDKAVQRIEDLQFAAPGLTVTSAGITQAVNIRGVGLASGSPSVTNGVSTYIDGLFQPPIVTTNSFFDIADVQVLRGPQGTFVGSASTGGAIFINSRNPTFDGVNGYLTAEVGNYSRKGLQGAVNLPVSSTFGLRGAFNYTDRKSFYTDRGAFNNDAGKLDELSGRLSALWKPSESFQALLKMEYSDKNTGGFAMRPVLTTRYAAGRVGGIRDLNYDTPTRNAERQDIKSLELRYVTASGITFRSLSGYQDKSVHNLTDIDSSSLNTAPAVPSSRQQQDVREQVTTEEINIISPTAGRWDWIVGGYYQKNKIDVLNLNFVGAAIYPQRIFIPTEKSTVGYFGQLSFQATEQLEVQLGLRKSAFKGEQTSGAGVYINFGAPTPPSNLRVANLEGTHKDNKPTGKLSVNWKFNPDNLLFAFVARGYKPGGFNSATSEFRPETVTDFELGWKSTFLGGRMRSSINLFNYDYKDFQAQTIDLGSGANNVTNVTDAKIKGAEVELQAQLGRWRLDGGLSYVDSKLGALTFVNNRLLPGTGLGPQCATGQTLGCFNYTPFLRTNSGGVNLYSPKLTYNLGAEYSFALAGGATLTPRLNYAYVSDQYINLLYDPTTDLLASRSLVSAQLSYVRGHSNLQLYVTNLADKDYSSGQLNNSEFYGAPRQIGARFEYRF
jgi:iron complex outermembrane recepter protein